MSKTRALLLASVGPALLATAAHAITVQHSEPLRGYRSTDQRGSSKPAALEPTTVTFNAFSRDFIVELEPNARLAPLLASLRLAPGTGAYRGRLAGSPGSWARLVLTPAGPAGIVYDGQTLFAIEVGGDSATATPPGTATMFRFADVYFTPGELACAAATSADNAAQAVTAMAREFTALNAAGATLDLRLGAVADFEFAQMHGANAETALLTRFNNVDGIFSEQLGVQVSVAEIEIFTTGADPFVATDPSALLDELANYRGATPAQDAQGLTYLFTGRDLDGTTAGIAYLGSVCAQRNSFDPRSFGVGLSEGHRGATIDSLVAAHEMGHSFGAPHDGETGSACATTPTTFLMAPSINPSDDFSACSINEMQREIATATCLAPIGGTNVAVALPRVPRVLAGITFNHTATVTSRGAMAATDVTFAAATEPGLELLGADAGAASCSVTPTTASCTVGTLASGVARGVTLTLRASQIGTFNLTATTAANQDGTTADNSAAVTVTAAPLVDLVVAGTPGTSLDVNGQATIDASLTNAADFEATAVTVSASLSSGLRADQATLSGTACAIAGQAISCPARTLAGRETLVLTVAATGLTAGSQRLTINATAAETDGTPGDNQLAVAVSVRALPTDEDADGGGGALSWLTVLALLFAYLGRRRAAVPALRSPRSADGASVPSLAPPGVT